ncbi:hypothetical protein Tco_1504666 [Tanacetum coccineum]
MEITVVTLVEEQMSLSGRVRRSGAQGCKAWRPSCIAWSGGQGWWSGGQDVGVVPKGVAWGKRVIMGRVHGCFWTANIGPGNEYLRKGQKQSQIDKTEHGKVKKHEKPKHEKSKSTKSQPSQSQSQSRN